MKRQILIKKRALLWLVGLLFSATSWGTTVSCGGNSIHNIDPACSGTWFVTQPDGTVSGPFYGFSHIASWGTTPGLGTVTVTYTCFAEDPPSTQNFYVIVGDGRLERPIVTAPNHSCNLSSFSVSIAPIADAADYTYSIPFGWKINGMAVSSITTTATSVTITAPEFGAGSGLIRVVANGEDCYLSSFNGTASVAYGVQTPDLRGPSTVSAGAPTHFYVEDYNYTDIEWIYPASWTLIGTFDEEIYIDLAATSPASLYPVRFNADLCGTAVTNLVVVEVIGDGGGGGVFIDEFAPEGMPEQEEGGSYGLSVNALEFSFYPNPTNGQVTIQIPESTADFELNVYDVTGKIVFTKGAVQNQSVLDVSFLPEGHYVVAVTNSEMNLVKRLVIK